MSRDLMDERLVSADVLDSLKRYVEDGIPVGDFLYAVLTNNLREAIGRADENNLATLPAIVCYCYNRIPNVSWGSPEAVRAWLKKKAEVRNLIEEGGVKDGGST